MNMKEHGFIDDEMIPDLSGENYITVLRRLHDILVPDTIVDEFRGVDFIPHGHCYIRSLDLLDTRKFTTMQDLASYFWL